MRRHKWRDPRTLWFIRMGVAFACYWEGGALTLKLWPTWCRISRTRPWLKWVILIGVNVALIFDLGCDPKPIADKP